MTRRRRKDGSQVHVELHALPLEAQGKQVGTYGIYQDITKRMQIEDELRQAQKMEGLGQFASGVAHDFNNVLAAILALTELALKQASPRNPLRWHAQKMRQQAQHASELTRQLLAFASGQVSEPLQLNLNQTVRTAVCLLEDVIGVQIQMETDLAPDLEDIWADPSQLEQPEHQRPGCYARGRPLADRDAQHAFFWG